MGLQWLKDLTALLNEAGIRSGEGWPGGKWTELAGPVAAVELQDLDYREGMAEFRIRILSPGVLGGWQCQHMAAEAVGVLENAGVGCRMEPMVYKAAPDCFEMDIVAQRYVMDGQEEAAAGLQVLIGETAVSHVTEFSAEQDRDRRLIGTVNLPQPVGITPPTGGWVIRMVQVIPAGGDAPWEPEEPFTLTLVEEAVTTVFSGCGWNRVKRQLDLTQNRVEWEGFALTREETENGEDEV